MPVGQISEKCQQEILTALEPGSNVKFTSYGEKDTDAMRAAKMAKTQ